MPEAQKASPAAPKEAARLAAAVRRAARQEQFLEVVDRDEAIARIGRHLQLAPLGKESVSLAQALGRVLAEDVVSAVDVPGFDRANVDGFALRAADTAGASPDSPRTLWVGGELAAGYVQRQPVPEGAAIRIMTGAPIPPAADAVVPFEDTDEYGLRPPGAEGPVPAEVRVFREAEGGANIRRRGQDVRKGERILAAGTVIRPAEAGVLASLGKTAVRVVRRPVVARFSPALGRRCGAITALWGVARVTPSRSD